MESLNSADFSGLAIDHLGLIADKIQDLDIIPFIDKRLPLRQESGVKVSMGERIAAMILNGLGFIDTRLYLFPEFLEKKPVSRLFGKALKSCYFNDDALGRCLDDVAAYGTTKLFTELSFSIGIKKKLLGKSVHFDTTSLQLSGAYADYDPDEALGPVPARGYSKSHRHDLKQMVLTLATTGKANFPLWMESHSGNGSDKKILPNAANRMRELCQGLSGADDFLYVGDSAFYTNILAYSKKMKWLTRVPEMIVETKKLLATEQDEIEWQPLGEGYRYSMAESNYKDVKQRWCMIFSEHAYQREIKTLDKNIAKEQASYEKLWWHLSNDLFTCADDAKKAIKSLSKKMKFHGIHTQVTPVIGYDKKGRPGKDEQAHVRGYKISAQLFTDEEKVEQIKRKKGRFILSTNELDKDKLKDSEMLAEYKAQSGTESGFKFIKNNAFEVDSIFLKTPERIDALMMVMTLCLMVYGVSQYELHQSLAASGQTLPNQMRKATATPSLKWIYFLFSGVQELTVALGEKTQQLVINVNDLLKQIVGYFGPRAQAIYLNSS